MTRASRDALSHRPQQRFFAARKSIPSRPPQSRRPAAATGRGGRPRNRHSFPRSAHAPMTNGPERPQPAGVIPPAHYLNKSLTIDSRLTITVNPSIVLVNKWLIAKITEHCSITQHPSQDVSGGYKPTLLPNSRLIRSSNGDPRQLERGFHLPYMWQYYLEGQLYDRIQKVGTGNCNPVTHGARCFRRNCRVRRGYL